MLLQKPAAIFDHRLFGQRSADQIRVQFLGSLPHMLSKKLEENYSAILFLTSKKLDFSTKPYIDFLVQLHTFLFCHWL